MEKEPKNHPDRQLVKSGLEAMEEALGFKESCQSPVYPISKKIPKKLADLVQR